MSKERIDDTIAFMEKHGGDDIDNMGQIVIYTGLMWDENDNIVPWVDPDADEDDGWDPECEAPDRGL